MAQSSGTQLEEAAIHAMPHTEFGIEARQFQVKVLCDMIFRSRRILMVRRTGDGKSVEPLGSLRASGGVGICVVPLLTIGCGQAAAATAACTSMEAVHWDDQPRDEKRLLLERL
jgi:superfamily II DNA helicase RecQ